MTKALRTLAFPFVALALYLIEVTALAMKRWDDRNRGNEP